MECFLFPCSSSCSSVNKKEESFMRNGGLLLEQLISLCRGKHNPIRTFSAKELKHATNNYAPSLIFRKEKCFCLVEWWYKGTLEGRPVSIRKFRGNPEDGLRLSIREIAMAIKVSNHRGALKLLGCCLQTPFPTLVYEFPPNLGLLDDGILLPAYREEGRRTGRVEENHYDYLTWGTRLKISFEIAHFISYLHTAFPTPIIHRDVTLSDIFLDDRLVPQFSNFMFSVVLPERETYIEDVVTGTCGYLAPEYVQTMRFTEKIDVYAFGVILLQFLTGQRTLLIESLGWNLVRHASSQVRTHGINSILDPRIILAEGEASSSAPEGEASSSALKLQQMEAVFRLAARCVKRKPQKRPTSTEAAKKLRCIQRGVFQDSEDDFVPNLAQLFESTATLM